MPSSKSTKQQKNVENQAINSDEKEELRLPILVARIWGLIAAISFMSNGGYLISESDTQKCKGAGAYMIIIGFITIIVECACCFFPIKQACFSNFQKGFPFWLKGLIYILSVLPILCICTGVKTIISSIIQIMLGLIYVFISCLSRSKKYERMNQAARVHYEQHKKNYQTVSLATKTVSNMNKQAVMNYHKSNQNKQKQKSKQKYKRVKNKSETV